MPGELDRSAADEEAEAVSVNLDLWRGHWFVACLASELQEKPLARMILNVPLVLFRSEGKPSVLVDRCPHRNAPLSAGRIVDGLIQCPYHGWTFDRAGQCRHIPGMAAGDKCAHHRAEVAFAQEYAGFIWVRLGEGEDMPRADLARLETMGSAKNRDRFLWSTRAECALVDGVENLLDACHPHFTHAGWVRVASKRRTVTVNVRRTRDGVEAVYEENQRAEGFIPRLLEGSRKASVGRFFPPATAQLEYLGEKKSNFVATSFFTPCDDKNVLIHTAIDTPRGWLPAFVKERVLSVILGKVLKQDQAILKLQQTNIARFGEARFISTPLDVMRPHIVYFLNHPDPGERVEHQSTLTMQL